MGTRRTTSDTLNAKRVRILAKPAPTFHYDRLTATMVNPAAHTAASWEALSDPQCFQPYVSFEPMRALVGVENDLLLNAGLGTTPVGMAGFLAPDGALTHDAGVSVPRPP